MVRRNIGDVQETKYGIQGLEYIPEQGKKKKMDKNTEITRGRK